MSNATEHQAPAGSTTTTRQYRYYDLVLGAFVCVLLCSNLIGVKKVTTVDLPLLGLVTFGAGNLFFPISYLFGDILTEVYGYARSRRVVWAGFAALVFASFQSAIVVHLPPAGFFAAADATTGASPQAMLEWAFGATWRIAGASLVAYFCGEFMNSFTLAKLKVLTNGRMLPLRTIGSTVVGEAVDSLIFYPLAFYGVWPDDQLFAVLIANYCIKVGWEVVATPLTIPIVNWFKRVEREDYFDRDTQFTPFSLKV
ncbi:MAG: queuosine precursor transporter [Deltaproteobacteria bacterium]|nr:queuosine precursor transporter [Deltaproteobacteria bacterium]